MKAFLASEQKVKVLKYSGLVGAIPKVIVVVLGIELGFDIYTLTLSIVAEVVVRDMFLRRYVSQTLAENS